MGKKTIKKLGIAGSLEPIYQLWGWILLVWALYRYFFHLSEPFDEFIAKPLIFVVPVIFYTLKHERKRLSSLGVTTNNFFTALYVGLGFGFIFALEGLAANAIKNGQLNITPITAFGQYGMIGLLMLSLATAISEEVLSRGFIFNRLYEKSNRLFFAAFMSTALFVLLHVPILVTTLHLNGMMLVLFFATDIILGFANALLLYNTGSLVAPILVHLFWNMTVALYL